jgi:hypothetical protein
MKHTVFCRAVITPALVLFFFSCAAAPPERVLEPAAPPQAAEPAPEKLQAPEAPRRILGIGRVKAEALAAFLVSVNPGVETQFAAALAAVYVEESYAEGVNHDTAFAQMCLETGFLRFGGLVKPEMNNFCGLGSIGPGQPGEAFPNPRIGVRAHIQHLKGYATTAPLNQALVDPRYRWVKYGSSPTIDGLAGTWASDPKYAEKIAGIIERLYEFAFSPPLQNKS